MTEKLPVPVVWNEDCLRHDPGGEVWLGVRDAGTEVAERALVLRDALAAAGAPVVPAAAHGDEILRAVHDPALLDHLAGVWAQWERAGFPAESAGTGWSLTCSPPRGCWPACRCDRPLPCTAGPGSSATTR